jgi:hypothetical protein
MRSIGRLRSCAKGADGGPQAKGNMNALTLHVMPGLVPGIHVFLAKDKQEVDARDKRGHDAVVRQH